MSKQKNEREIMKKLTISLLMGMSLGGGLQANAEQDRVELSVQKPDRSMQIVRNSARIWDADSFNEALDRAEAGYMRGTAVIMAKTKSGATETFSADQWEEFRRRFNDGRLRVVWFYEGSVR